MSAITRYTQPPIVAPKVSSDNELITLWLSSKKRQSPHTQRAYRADIEAFRQATGFKPLAAVSVADLEWYAAQLAGRGLKPASQRRMVSSIRSLLTYGLKVGFLPFNVGAAVDLETLPDELSKRILTKRDTARLVELEPDEVKRAIIHLNYVLATRVSELCGLRWADVTETETGYVFRIVGKRNKVRNLHVERDAVRADLDVLRARNTASLVGVGTCQVWRYVRDAAARAGLDRDANGDERHISPHWLRHACLSHAQQKGAPTVLVMEYAGHASLATTTRYSHAMPGEGLSKYL